MNSKCGVQSKRRCESHESCVCIVGFPACGCQKKSVFLPRRSSRYHSIVPIPLPRPDTSPSSRYNSIVPIPLPRPDTTPSSRYHSLVQIPLPRPSITPSFRYHSLVAIPLHRPNTTPSSRYHSLRPHDPVPVTICIATLLTETHRRRRRISGSLYILRKRYRTAATSLLLLLLLLLKCCFTSTETVGVLGTGAQDVHFDFHTAPEHCCHFGGVHAAGNVSSDSTQRRTPPRLLYAPY